MSYRTSGGSLRAMGMVVVALLASLCASAADFTGRWSGSSKSAGTMYAVLKQDGATLTGTAGPGESRQLPITAGKVEGDHVTFQVKMGAGTILLDLTSVESELRGTMRISSDGGETDSADVVLKRIPQ